MKFVLVQLAFSELKVAGWVWEDQEHPGWVSPDR